jgi:hypothetical protein
LSYNIGDIVIVHNFTYSEGTKGTAHSFVIMDIDNDEFQLVNFEYLCFLISSKTDKNNDVNTEFPYNEPIHPDNINRLKRESHVKCDILYEIKEDDIIMQIGKVTHAQYERFIDLYESSLE